MPQNKSSLINLLMKLWFHLGKNRQGQFVLLSLLMLMSAFAEVASLGVALPFLGMFVAPAKIFNYPLINDFGLLLHITDPNQMILPLTVAFVTIVVLAAIVRLTFLWFSTQLAQAIGSDISIEVYRRTLYQPFAIHVSRNSSEVISGILSKVHFVVYGVLIPIMTMTSSIVLLVTVTVALVIINPSVAVIITLGFGSFYALMASVFRKRLGSNSNRIAIEKTQSVKALQEGLGGIRDVLLDGLQPVYCEIYREADLPLRKAEAENTFIGQSPRYVMEGFGLVLIATIAYTMNSGEGGIAMAIPVLGVFVLAAQRLLPSLQQAYSSWASIVGSHASLADTISLLDQEINYQENHLIEPMIFESTIKFNNINFKYKQDDEWILKDITFTIKKGMRVGFVGMTGSGKSTLLDLFMGLLIQNEGDIFIDEKCINGKKLKSWQKLVAHVPQSIYLADTSFAENIAFGVAKQEIDWDRLRIAAQQAQISEFIESLPEGYHASVGERGMRLSGGQRQRIGIARALYKNAAVLVLDEATSALDNNTEKAFMDALLNIDSNLTILLIAHRLSTVKNCDLLIELESGKVKCQGTYDELLLLSPSFRRMVDSGKD